MTYAQAKAMGDWHRRRAHRYRVLAEALRIKLSNPMAKAHPLYETATLWVSRFTEQAQRHTNIAARFAN